MNLIKVIKELRSDLFYQIESKVGAKKARQYPSIKLADDTLKNIESSSRIIYRLNDEVKKRDAIIIQGHTEEKESWQAHDRLVREKESIEMTIRILNKDGL